MLFSTQQQAGKQAAGSRQATEDEWALIVLMREVCDESPFF